MSPRVFSRRKGADPVPPDAAYVGRPTKWGNPFVVGKDGGRGECVKLYREWMTYQPGLRAAARDELAGRDLVCWCQCPSDHMPNACHATVLVEIANSPEGMIL